MTGESAVLHQDASVKPSHPPRVLRRVGNVVTTLVSVVVVVVGSLALVLSIATHFAPAHFTAFGHPMLIVVSGSMSPVVNTGDVVIDSTLTPYEAAHLHAGQIITFSPSAGGAETHTHRIVAVRSVGGGIEYITKGDANPAPDAALVAPSQIVGVYDARIPAAGYVVNALRQPLTLALLLAAPALWLLSGYLFALAREADEKPKANPPNQSAASGGETR